jgi:hypothetical protein
MRVLHTSAEIHEEIFRIFRRVRQRRVALVAYVGKGAVSQLPNPKGLELYCWPQAPGTHPAAIEKLQELEADVYFAPRLHMKVYWSERDGAVIGSANLSDNALGAGDLREVAVAVPSSSVDIDLLIELARGRLVDDDALDELRQATAKWNQKRPPQGSIKTTFAEWYDQPRHKRWKWDYVNDSGGGISRRAKKAVRHLNPAWTPHNYVYCSRGRFKAKDWILKATLGRGGQLMSPRWLFVECVVLVGKRDPVYEPEYPYQAVQARELSSCPAPPFELTAEFNRALRNVSREAGHDRMVRQVDARYPTAGLLKALRARV